MKKIIGLILALVMVFASAMPVFATENDTAEDVAVVTETETEPEVDPVVQAAYDAFLVVKAAIEVKDLAALKVATPVAEAANEALEMEQVEELEAMDEDFWTVTLTAAMIMTTSDLYDAFLADKNANTALAFMDNYEIHYEVEEVMEVSLLIREMIPDIDTVYEEAMTYVPSDDIVAVYDAFYLVQVGLEMGWVEDLAEAAAGFEAVLDIFNEMTEEDLTVLAELMGVEDAETAWGIILVDWVNTNIVLAVGEVYDAFNNDPNAETAAAFIEMYDGVYNDPDYVDEELRELVSYFFLDIDATYELALEEIDPSDDGNDGETPDDGDDDDKTPDEDDKDDSSEADKDEDKDEDKDDGTTPDTGDDTSMLPLVMMLVSAAGIVMLVAFRKRKA